MPLFDDTRADWHARPPRDPNDLAYVAPSRRSEFMVHYDGGTPVMVGDHADCLARVRKDQDFHMDGRGWNDVGYNGLVCQHGRAIEGRGPDYAGAHCTNHNTSGYGFQFMVGGAQAPTPAAYARMARLLAECEARSGHALRKMGHRDGLATACPGTIVYAWVKAGMPGPVVVPGSAVPNLPKPAPKPKPVPKPNFRLDVDGIIGPNTIRAWQHVMGTVADGVISRPSLLVKAVQRVVGVKRDGYLGPITWRAIQRRLGVTADGIPGPITIRALQRRLNGGSF